MTHVHLISPCLWFDGEAETAANFYTAIFPNSAIRGTTHFTRAGEEIHGRPPGSVMTVEFEIAGQHFTALNGGPMFRFNEAVSLQVRCEDQREIDYYWERLGDGGDPAARQCGWLKDRYGLSWQIVPACLGAMLAAAEPEAAERILDSLMGMRKLDIGQLEEAGR